MCASNFANKYLPKRMETYILAKICIQMFTTDLFIVDKNWKQPNHLQIGEWLINFHMTAQSNTTQE